MDSALDETWFDRYHAIKIAIGEAYEMLEPLPATLDTKRQEFEASNHQSNVSLLSDRVDVDMYLAHIADLTRLADDIKAMETNKLIKELYLDAIRDLDATARLIIASSTGDTKQYQIANSVLYDQPDEHVFKALCHWIRSDAQISATDRPELRVFADKVLSLIPDVNDNHQLLVPSERVFHSVRETHRESGGYYDHLFGPQHTGQSLRNPGRG